MSIACVSYRHVSTTNIDDISGNDSCLYRSEESLPAAIRREERGRARGNDESSEYSSSILMAGRAISCSDLLFDIERPKVCVWVGTLIFLRN